MSVYQDRSDPHYEVDGGVVKQLKTKTLLFDSCTIVNILKFDSEDLLEYLRSLECQFAYIRPVFIELMRCDRAEDRVTRLGLLDQFQFFEISINQQNLISKTEKIQEELHAHQSHPYPEDIYLGATVATIGLSDLFLLTMDQKDFPVPVYRRVGNILIQNEKKVRAISLIKYNDTTH